MNGGDIPQIWAGKAEPILPTSSIERTIAFYSGLGFTTGVWEDDEGYAWVHPGPTRDGIYIDYSLTEDLNPFTSAGMAYLTVSDVDAVYAALIEAGVVEAIDEEGLPQRSTRELRQAWARGESLSRVARPINQVWGKRELALFDPDNNLIRIGSELT